MYAIRSYYDRLPALEVTLRRATRVIDHGVGANVLDSPLNALAFLIEVLAKQPEARNNFV